MERQVPAFLPESLKAACPVIQECALSGYGLVMAEGLSAELFDKFAHPIELLALELHAHSI